MDEFEQPPPAIQLFYRYFKATGEKTEGEGIPSRHTNKGAVYKVVKL